MRETKFRAWQHANQMNNNSEMLSWEELARQVSVEWVMRNDTGYVLMQYTGLKDKNGVEIYEGDIVRSLGGDRFTIEFVDGSFVAVREAVRTNGYFWRHLKLQVIGNIYETPELLG